MRSKYLRLSTDSLEDEGTAAFGWRGDAAAVVVSLVAAAVVGMVEVEVAVVVVAAAACSGGAPDFERVELPGENR